MNLVKFFFFFITRGFGKWLAYGECSLQWNWSMFLNEIEHVADSKQIGMDNIRD